MTLRKENPQTALNLEFRSTSCLMTISVLYAARGKLSSNYMINC